MQQKKLRHFNSNQKLGLGSIQISKRINTLGVSKSPVNRQKLGFVKNSFLRQFKKVKGKLQNSSAISSPDIQQQTKKEIALAKQLLMECEKIENIRDRGLSEKEEFIELERVIKRKNQVINALNIQIQQLKNSVKDQPDEVNHSIVNQPVTDNSQKQRKFKLLSGLKTEREQLLRYKDDHTTKYGKYIKIKNLIEELQQKHIHQESATKNGKDAHLMTYEQFKERFKQESPIKHRKVEISNHQSLQKQSSPSKTMKDLINRKNITLTALRSARKKHAVDMSDLLAKLQFLKDEDILLNEKIAQEEEELKNMQKRFNERRVESPRTGRNKIQQRHWQPKQTQKQ